MKQRIVGRVNGETYEIVAPDGMVMRSIPLDEARSDRQVRKAIERNPSWEAI